MAYKGSVVAPQSEIVANNSWAENLATATTNTGDWIDTNGVACVTVAASSTYSVTLTIEESQDASSVDLTRTTTVAASTETRRLIVPARRYVRVKVANASGSTAALRVETRIHGTTVDPRWLLADPTWREHRRISEADVTTEIAETGATSWMGGQAIASRATDSDPIGLYKRASTGTCGFEAVCFWINDASSDAVVYSTALVTLRPVEKFTLGAATRIVNAAAAQTKAPGEVFSFADTAPALLWLKVDAATAPGGAETHLAIYVREVQQ